MQILLTAFEPFDDTGLNSSLQGGLAFLDRWGGEFQVRFGVLPVSYGPDVARVEGLLREGPTDLVLHLGQATRAPAIRVEQAAVNRRYRQGAPRDPEDWIPIDPEGPPRLETSLPVGSIAAAIQAAGVAAVVSHDAGVYLCNHTLYHSLLRAGRAAGPERVGFLHIPSLPEQAANGAPSMTADEVALAIRAALRFLVG